MFTHTNRCLSVYMLWIISFVLIVRPERLNSRTTGQYIIKIKKKTFYSLLLLICIFIYQRVSNSHFHLPIQLLSFMWHAGVWFFHYLQECRIYKKVEHSLSINWAQSFVTVHTQTSINIQPLPLSHRYPLFYKGLASMYTPAAAHISTY